MNDDGLFGDDPLIARLIGYGIAAVIAAVLMLTPMGAAAQTTPPEEPACLPNDVLLKGTGTAYKVFETADMHGEVGWCPTLAGGWYISAHRWCLRTQCDKAPPNAWSLFLGAADRIRAASAPMVQLRTEWKAAGVPLKTDLEHWQFRDWRYQACQWLTSTQPGVTPRPAMPIALPNNTWVPPLDYCAQWAPGVKPLPPPAPCAAQAVTWTQGTASCTAQYAGDASGTSAQLADTTAPDTGTVTAACTNGVLATSAPLCTSPPPPTVAYVVTPDGTKPERQWFQATLQPNGTWKRSITAGGTTPVGGTCDCIAINFVEFNITRYCRAPVPNVATAVTACMVKK